jgi:hypothetical protein
MVCHPPRGSCPSNSHTSHSKISGALLTTNCGEAGKHHTKKAGGALRRSRHGQYYPQLPHRGEFTKVSLPCWLVFAQVQVQPATASRRIGKKRKARARNKRRLIAKLCPLVADSIRKREAVELGLPPALVPYQMMRHPNPSICTRVRSPPSLDLMVPELRSKYVEGDE